MRLDLVGLIEKVDTTFFARNNARQRWGWVGYGLTILALIFLVFTFFSDQLNLQVINLRTIWPTILISLSIYLFSLLVQFIVWARLISFHGKITWKDVEIYSRMIMMRRIPGGPWHWLGRSAMYRTSTELPLRVPLLGSMVEWILMFIVCGALFIFSLERIQSWMSFLLISVLFIISMGIAISWQPKQRPILNRAIESGGWILLYLLAWISSYLIFSILLNGIGVTNIGWREELRIWTLSAGIGMLFVLFPATFGIVEASLATLLQQYINPPLAVLVAIAIRLIYTIADAMWGILGWVFSKYLFNHFEISNQKPPLSEQ